MALEHNLEAALFFKGEPETRARLVKLLETTEEELDEAVQALSGSLHGRGIQLLVVNDSLELVTAPGASAVITQMRKDELSRDLGKAGAETLAIVLYKAPVSRVEIEYIRGVNCSFIVRNLTVRGLIEKTAAKKGRVVQYQPTAELLKHLGVTAVEALPDYETIHADLVAFEEAREATEMEAAAQGEQVETDTTAEQLTPPQQAV
jgi:segregation and condensation protein B